MDFLKLAEQRSSIRKYQPKEIPGELLCQVLEAGRLAPSACNLQPWQFIAVKDPARKAALCEAYPRDWIQSAPVIIAVCSKPAEAWTRKYDGKNSADIDCAIATDHITLCAQTLGLGTCWVCAFDPAKARAALELPDDTEPVILLPIGWPDQPIPAKTRKPAEEIIRII